MCVVYLSKVNERVDKATAAAVAETMRNAGSPSIFGQGKDKMRSDVYICVAALGVEICL